MASDFFVEGNSKQSNRKSGRDHSLDTVMYYCDWMTRLTQQANPDRDPPVSIMQNDYKSPCRYNGYDLPPFYAKRRMEKQKRIQAKDKELSRLFLMNFDHYSDSSACSRYTKYADDANEAKKKEKDKLYTPELNIFPGQPPYTKECPPLLRTPIIKRKNVDWQLRKAHDYDAARRRWEDRYSVTGVYCPMDKGRAVERRAVHKPRDEAPVCRCPRCHLAKTGCFSSDLVMI